MAAQQNSKRIARTLNLVPEVSVFRVRSTSKFSSINCRVIASTRPRLGQQRVLAAGRLKAQAAPMNAAVRNTPMEFFENSPARARIFNPGTPPHSEVEIRTNSATPASIHRRHPVNAYRLS
jgi:hypothetical protein